MLNLSIRQVDFNELKVENISKRPILDALKQFWTKSETEFYEFLEQNNLDFYKNFSSMAELKEFLSKDIAKLNAIGESGASFFDYKIINALKPRYLKEISDYEFFKITIDLREANPEHKQSIIDLFLETKSVSLIDFVDVTEDSCSLICHKKGAFYYHKNPFMTNTRVASVSLLENYKEPKDNNFILARFLFDFANKLDENDIKESISVIGYNNEKMVKHIDEIIYWGNLSAEEKEDMKEALNQEKKINEEAKNIAKSEIKQEVNATRESFKQEQSHKAVEEHKGIRLEIDENMNLSNIENMANEKKPIQKNVEIDSQIANVVAKSIELYKQKEAEKFRIKMERAERDSVVAYNDLKEYLNNGLSILEAIKNIQQKYRNDDTINLASLLFSKDVLSLSAKQREILDLNKEKDELKKEIESAYNEVERKEETISKLRSTLQTKINEVSNIRYEVEKEFESKLQEQEAQIASQLEKIEANQKEVISAYSKEIESLNIENEKLIDEAKEMREINIKLDSQVSNLKEEIKNSRQENDNLAKDVRNTNNDNIRLIAENKKLEEALERTKKDYYELQQDSATKLKDMDASIKSIYKLEAQLDFFKEKEKSYKEQISELKSKNSDLEDKLLSIVFNGNGSEAEKKKEPKKNIRSRDILGDS